MESFEDSPAELHAERDMVPEQMYHLATVGKVDAEVAPTPTLARAERLLRVCLKLDSVSSALVEEHRLDCVFQLVWDRYDLYVRVPALRGQSSDLEGDRRGAVLGIQGAQSLFVPVELSMRHQVCGEIVRAYRSVSFKIGGARSGGIEENVG